MSIEQIVPLFVIIPLLILILSIVMRILKQPYVIGFILTGIILTATSLIQDTSQLHILGEIGIILLMFFIGMEISLPTIIAGWRIAILGPIFQIILSTITVHTLGTFLGWSWEKSMLIGFIITLSSTAVIIKILEDLGELKSKIGQNVIAILIVQDLLVIPMMIAVKFVGVNNVSNSPSIITTIIGSILLTIFIYLVLTHKIKIPFPKKLLLNHELQIFVSLVACFGLASISSKIGLSAALGAFFAGIIIGSFKGTQWAHDTLHSFKVVFTALFFVYIGAIINLEFVQQNYILIMGLVLAVFIINTTLNACILRFLKTSWKESIYAGSLLSQIGEFSFLLGAVGVSSAILLPEEYNLIVSVIAFTLLFSPIWISIVKRVLHIETKNILNQVEQVKKEITRAEIAARYRSYKNKSKEAVLNDVQAHIKEQTQKIHKLSKQSYKTVKDKVQEELEIVNLGDISEIHSNNSKPK